MEKEIERLRPFAEAGDAKAQYDLGDCFWKQGDLENAMKWLRMAAEKGLPDAIEMLQRLEEKKV